MFRIYRTSLFFDCKHFTEVWIDPHYEEKHRKSISDELILILIHKMSGRVIQPSANTDGFRYYEVDLIHLEKPYRLILVRPLDDSYLGVRNAYRRALNE